MSKTYIDVEIDFNNLFNLNLSYSFDILKGALEAINKNQKVTNTKIHDFEEQIKNLINDNK